MRVDRIARIVLIRAAIVLMAAQLAR